VGLATGQNWSWDWEGNGAITPQGNPGLALAVAGGSFGEGNAVVLTSDTAANAMSFSTTLPDVTHLPAGSTSVLPCPLHTNSEPPVYDACIPY